MTRQGGALYRFLPEGGESSCLVHRSVNRSQLGPAGVVGLGPACGGRAQRTAGAGERGQSVAVRCHSVPSKQLVRSDAGSAVFQDEESGRRVGGDDARGKADPEILAEELERSQFGTQPPWCGTRIALPVRYPLDDDGARKDGSALKPDPRHGPRLHLLPTVDSDRRGEEIGQEVLQRIESEDPSRRSRHALTLRLDPPYRACVRGITESKSAHLPSVPRVGRIVRTLLHHAACRWPSSLWRPDQGRLSRLTCAVLTHGRGRASEGPSADVGIRWPAGAGAVRSAAK